MGSSDVVPGCLDKYMIISAYCRSSAVNITPDSRGSKLPAGVHICTTSSTQYVVSLIRVFMLLALINKSAKWDLMPHELSDSSQIKAGQFSPPPNSENDNNPYLYTTAELHESKMYFYLNRVSRTTPRYKFRSISENEGRDLFFLRVL